MQHYYDLSMWEQIREAFWAFMIPLCIVMIVFLGSMGDE